MSWTLVRRLLIAGGIVYAVALIPGSIRPEWSAAPFRKGDQTITVPAESAQGRAPVNMHDRLRNACRATWIVRPLEGPARHVRVVLIWKGKSASIRDYECKAYVT